MQRYFLRFKGQMNYKYRQLKMRLIQCHLVLKVVNIMVFRQFS